MGRRDISEIIDKLHEVVDEAIETNANRVGEKPSGPWDISRIDFDRLRKEFERSKTKNTTVQCLKDVIDERLRRLIERNPLRADFQRHYETIVAEYNREKDRATIEETFEDLLRFFKALDEEDRRAMREGLDEETLAIFDLLKKQDLSISDVKRIKEVAAALLERLKAEKLKVDHWRDKESTRDAVRVEIRDFLWSDDTGLPIGAYSEKEVDDKAEDIYLHIFYAYPTLLSPYYVPAV